MEDSCPPCLNKKGKTMKETICKKDGEQFNYKFVVTGTFEGDEGETISKERILDVARISDSSTAWNWLFDADFELDTEEKEKEVDNLTEIIQQLWECLSRGYTYQEAKIHIRAFKDGKTTRKRLVVEEVV